MKSSVEVLARWHMGPVGGEPRRTRIELHRNSDGTFGVRVAVEDAIVDEEWFADLFDAREYADEMRQIVTDRIRDEERTRRELLRPPAIEVGAGVDCVDAVSNAIRQGYAGDVLKLLKTAGLA